MKNKNKIIILFFITLNLGIIYLAFLFGKNQATLTNSQISCLAEGVSEEKLIISTLGWNQFPVEVLGMQRSFLRQLSCIVAFFFFLL